MSRLRMVFVLTVGLLLAAATVATRPGSIQLSGIGPFLKGDLRQSFQLIEESASDEGLLSSNYVEDAALLTLNKLRKSGRLEAEIVATLIDELNQERTLRWTLPYEPQTERGERFVSAAFAIQLGKRYYYQSISFSGLHTLSEEEALARFYPPAPLIDLEARRVFSPSLLETSIRNLLAALENRGKASARVVDRQIESDPDTGATRVSLTIDEGSTFFVKSLQIIVDGEIVGEEARDEIFNRAWTRNLKQQCLDVYRERGHADAMAEIRVADRNNTADTAELRMVLDIERGDRYSISRIVYTGAEATRPQLLKRKISLRDGELLDGNRIEQARFALSSLNVFDRVDVNYTDDGPGARVVEFRFKERPRLRTDALLGYGSYERVRGGFTIERSNLFGRAHHLSLSAVQSMKSTSGDLRYALPMLFGEPITTSLKGSFLDREERSFDRLERGLSAQLSTFLERPRIVLDFEYTYEQTEARNAASSDDFLFENTRVGSITFRASRSKVDNPIYPKNGYQYGLSMKSAAPVFGSESEYSKIEGNASWMKELSRNIGLRLGGKLGYVVSPLDNSSSIPFGERFVLGGENSVRGYEHGQASPFDANGVAIGSEAYLQMNGEIEYKLFEKLSAVLFLDAVSIAENSGRLNEHETLASLGAGLRFRTIVGPIRLEYGKNINPRPNDPSGALHLSVGAPF